MSSGSMMLRQRSTLLRPQARAAALLEQHLCEVGMLPRPPALAAQTLVPSKQPQGSQLTSPVALSWLRAVSSARERPPL